MKKIIKKNIRKKVIKVKAVEGEPINIQAVFHGAYDLFVNNFMQLIVFSAVFLALLLPGQLLKNFRMDWLIVVSIICIFVLAYLTIVYVSYVSLLYMKKKKKIGELFTSNLNKYFKYISTIIVYFVLIQTGFVLAVIPGIYLSIVLLPALYAAIIENQDIRPYKMSFLIAKNNFWKMFVIQLLVSFPMLLTLFFLDQIVKFGAISPVNLLIVSMLYIIYIAYVIPLQTVLYFKLRESKSRILAGSEIDKIKGFTNLKGCLNSFLLMFIFLIIAVSMTMILIKTEFFKSIMSADILFNNGIRVERPAGWIAQKNKFFLESYELSVIKYGSTRQIVITSVPEKTLSDAHFMADNETQSDFSGKVVLRTYKIHNPTMYDIYKRFKIASDEEIKINNRDWNVLVLKDKRWVDENFRFFIMKIYSTMYKNDLVVVYYILMTNESKTEIQEPLNVEPNTVKIEREMIDIIKAIEFP